MSKYGGNQYIAFWKASVFVISGKNKSERKKGTVDDFSYMVLVLNRSLVLNLHRLHQNNIHILNFYCYCFIILWILRFLYFNFFFLTFEIWNGSEYPLERIILLKSENSLNQTYANIGSNSIHITWRAQVLFFLWRKQIWERKKGLWVIFRKRKVFGNKFAPLASKQGMFLFFIVIVLNLCDQNYYVYIFFNI